MTQGLTVKGLIAKADGLLEGVYMDRAVLSRTNPDKSKESLSFRVDELMKGGAADILLQKGDTVQIAAIADFVSKYTVQLDGEVRKPGTYPYKNNLSLKDLLFLAGGFTDAGTSYHIEVGRRIQKENELLSDSIAEVIVLNIDKDLAINGEKFTLKPFDLVTVRKNPGYKAQKRVTIKGEVVYPGTYTIKTQQERVSDLLKRSGGLTPYAYKDGLFLIRKNNLGEGTENIAEKEEIVRRSLKDTTDKVIADLQRVNTKIAINTQKILNDPGSIEDYVLEEGDIIEVIKFDPLVKLTGEVLLSTKTNFVDGRNMRYYLGKGGGTTDKARRSRIYVLYANGSVGETKNPLWGLFRSYPKVLAGSEIIVPSKKDKKGMEPAAIVGLASTLVSLTSLIIITISTLNK